MISPRASQALRLFARTLLVSTVGLATLVDTAWSADLPPTLKVTPPSAPVAPGSKTTLQVVVTFGDRLHGYQNPPSEDWMIPVTVAVEGSGVRVSRVSYPKGASKVVGGLDTPALVYSGATRIPVEIVAPTKPGVHRLTVRVDYQQCDDQNCYPPGSVTQTVSLTVKAASGASTTDARPPTVGTPESPTMVPNPPDETVVKPRPDGTTTTTPSATEPAATAPTAPQSTSTQADDSGTSGPEPSPSEVGTITPPVATANPTTLGPGTPAGTTVPQATPTAAEPTERGLSALLQKSFREKNYLVLFGLLFIAGLLINLTPCVYPMIPITLGFFSNQAGDRRAARFGLGAMYMLGIAVTYGLVGGIAAGAGATFGSLFTQVWFNYALALLMIGLALSMFDVYQIGLPPFISRQLKGRSGAVGALIMGLLVGVAAAPCAGPVVVAVFSEVARLRDVPMGVLVFTAMGVGLGLPYLLLAAASSGAAKSLPKAGGWMKAVKALLGFVVLGVGLNYLIQALPRTISEPYSLHIWAAFYGLSALYLIFLDRSGTTNAIFGIKGVAVLVAGVLIGMGVQQINTPEGAVPKTSWIPLTETSWAAAKASGKPIFIDATANWCAECRVIEAKVLKQPESVEALNSVVTLKIDWSTGVDPAYQKWTANTFDIKGLPHLIVAKPGGETSRVFNHLETPAELIAALNAVRTQP